MPYIGSETTRDLMVGQVRSRDSEHDIAMKKTKVGQFLPQISPTIVDEELQESEKPYRTPIKAKPVPISSRNQIDLHTIS